MDTRSAKPTPPRRITSASLVSLRAAYSGLAAGLATRRMRALGFRVRLGHVFASLGLAIPFVTHAMVDLGRCVDPYLACATAGCRFRSHSLLRLRRRGRHVA